MPHRRDLQIAALIKSKIAEYCQLNSLLSDITILDVTMQDKKNAMIHYVPTQTSLEYESLIALQKKLDSTIPQIRHYVAQETNMRAIPQIRFSPSLENLSP